MKKSIIGVVVLVLVVVGFGFLLRDAQALVGQEVLVSTFMNQGEPTGKVLVQVPYLRTLKERSEVSVAVDFDQDGTFSAEEYLVRDVPTLPQANWRTGYYASTEEVIESDMSVLVVVGDDKYRARSKVQSMEVGELLDIETVTDPENATKGWGVEVVYADDSDSASKEVNISQNGVPDLNQKKGECAPTSAANSLISLVDKFGGEDLIPGDPEDFIENLKRHMDWTPENGVLPDDFVTGKNQWAAAAGVPIRTTKVGDAHGLSTIEDIKEALERGDSAVELRIKLADATGSQAISGHMVTVTGIYQGPTGTFLEINDPITPDSGTEQIKIEGNQIVDYGPWLGKVILSWGFVQTWEGHPTGELLDPMTDAEIQGIKEFVGEQEVVKVIEFRGDHIPVSQLFVGPKHPPHDQGEGCPEDHWHADRPVTSVEGRTFSDPNSGGCGFGTVSANPSRDYTLPSVSQSAPSGRVEVRGLEGLKQE